MTSSQGLPNKIKTPGWLQRIQWLHAPLEFFDQAGQTYGDIFSTDLVPNSSTVIFVSHPDALQQILTSTQFVAPPDTFFEPFLGQYSILSMTGKRHRRERKLLMPSFHGEQVCAYAENIIHITKGKLQSLPIDKPFLAGQLFESLMIEIIIQTVFGTRDLDQFEQVKQAIERYIHALRIPWTVMAVFFAPLRKDWGRRSPWGYLQALQREISTAIYAEIRACRQQPDPSRTDVLSLLVAAQDEMGQGLSDQELHDEIMTLLLIGHGTTAAALTWSMYWIYSHPKVRNRLTAELESCDLTSNPVVAAQLPYLTAVSKEVLRICPMVVVTTPRKTKDTVELLGHPLQPGTQVYGCIYLTHQRPDLYPEPKQFRPERFLERQFSPYEFLPFGGGARRCIGEALAMLEIKLIMATFLSGYHFQLVSSQPVIPQLYGVVVVPTGGVKTVLKAKQRVS